MASMAVEVARTLNRACLLAVDAQGCRLLHVVTRAKNNVVAYADAPPKTRRRGAPRKYGRKISIRSLFGEKDLFQEVTLDIYQESKPLLFYCIDLLWKPIGEKVRFVLVIDGNEKFILMSSDLNLSTADIILAYSYRFKIE